LLKVLVIPSWYPPDGGQFFQDHAGALAEAGFRVDVLVNRIIGLSKLRFSELSSLRRFQVSEVNGTRLVRSFYLKWPKNELLNIRKWAGSTHRLFRQYERTFGSPDVILAHSSIWAGYAASLVAAGTGIPYIITEHRSRFTGLTAAAKSLLRDAYHPFLKKAFGGASRIVTVSDALQATIRPFVPAGQQILTIPNMVDTDFFVPPSGRQRDPLVILSVGRLEQEKGMDLLIRAFGQLAGDIPGASLRIVGKGPQENRLRAMASELGGRASIHFLGKLPPGQLLAELHRAKILAVPSRFEAFGVVFIEAMSTGLPVLAARSGGPESFVREMTGRLVDSDSIPAVYDGLKYIYDHYGDYDPARIRRYAEENFGREQVIRKYTGLIREVCHDKG
jgi:glycosyltransferase involved in cell wall biosynthesis